MANPLKGEIELEAAGTTYTLCFPTNAIVEVEQVLGGKSIGDITANLTHVENVRALLWAALRTHHADVDLIKAGDVIDDFEGGIKGVGDAVARALRFRLSGTPIDQPLADATPQ